jgi:hypothetical protein
VKKTLTPPPIPYQYIVALTGDDVDHDGNGAAYDDIDDDCDGTTGDEVDDDCDGTTGDKVDDDGDGAMGYDDDDDDDVRRRRRRHQLDEERRGRQSPRATIAIAMTAKTPAHRRQRRLCIGDGRQHSQL